MNILSQPVGEFLGIELGGRLIFVYSFTDDEEDCAGGILGRRIPHD